MGSAFREAVFERLRPQLRIHGDRAEGFYFSWKDEAQRRGWWGLHGQGEERWSLDWGDARREGFRFYGDACLVLTHFPGFASWASFAAEVILHAAERTGASGWQRVDVRRAPNRAGRSWWREVLSRCVDRKGLQVVPQLVRLPSVKRTLRVHGGGNGFGLLLEGSGGFYLLEFSTS